MSAAKVVSRTMRIVSGANLREHFRVKHLRVKGERAVGFGIGVEISRAVELPIVLTLTRIAPRKLDSDNLQYAFKAIRDGIAAAYGVKDNDDTVIDWRYSQRTGVPRQYAIEASAVQVTP